MKRIITCLVIAALMILVSSCDQANRGESAKSSQVSSEISKTPISSSGGATSFLKDLPAYNRVRFMGDSSIINVESYEIIGDFIRIKSSGGREYLVDKSSCILMYFPVQ